MWNPGLIFFCDLVCEVLRVSNSDDYSWKMVIKYIYNYNHFILCLNNSLNNYYFSLNLVLYLKDVGIMYYEQEENFCNSYTYRYYCGYIVQCSLLLCFCRFDVVLYEFFYNISATNVIWQLVWNWQHYFCAHGRGSLSTGDVFWHYYNV